MTYSLSVSFTLHRLELGTCIERALESNHRSGTREGEYRSCPTCSADRAIGGRDGGTS